jgi:predicted nicotinamide N-methyase
MMNLPRNVLLTQGDPREPVICQFQHSVGALKYAITIHQTPREETWPGGALWDCGLLLAQLLLAVAGIGSLTTIHTLLPQDDQAQNNSKKKTHTRTTLQLATRLQTWLQQQQQHVDATIWKSHIEPVLLHRHNLTVIELGCGVGLTGLVAAIALGAVTTILTDLTAVVDQVTLPNVIQNTTPVTEKGRRRASATSAATTLPSCRSIQHFKGGGKVVAMPLCWGNTEEGAQALQVLKQLHPQSSLMINKTKGKKGTKKAQATINNNNNDDDDNDDDNMPIDNMVYPDLILLGDVAYQHKPGAPSHFDILVESIKQLMAATGKSQLLLFGTRLRMPASSDLLELLQQHFTPLLQQPIPAQVLDPALQGVKHNMTIHIFTNNSSTSS